MSTAQTRKARRDYWNSPNVVTAAKVWDVLLRFGLVAVVLTAGSIVL